MTTTITIHISGPKGAGKTAFIALILIPALQRAAESANAALNIVINGKLHSVAVDFPDKFFEGFFRE